MWQPEIQKIENGISHYKILKDKLSISFAQWIKNVKESKEFATFFIELLKNAPYNGYFWEVKPITKNNINSAFEFVLVESSLLPKIKPDSSSFKQYFKEGQNVTTFPNLNGDAQLIVPTSIAEPNCYAHLASFVRKAPEAQVSEFWRIVGKEFEKAIGENIKWLSTAGLGVYWLHIRIDSRPKYYRYEPYRRT